jgi:HEPN domain-containing protein
MKERAKEYLNKGVAKLKSANEELFRPEEDVVTYSVCKNSQFAIENYLKGYLLNNSVEVDEYKTIAELLAQCVLINNNFKKLDFSDIDCKVKTLDSRYCSSIEKVNSCFDAADSLDTLLRQEQII